MYNVIKFTLTIVSFKFFNSEGRKPTILNILVQNDNPWQDACLIPFFQSNAKPGQTAVMIKTLNCFFFFFLIVTIFMQLNKYVNCYKIKYKIKKIYSSF